MRRLMVSAGLVLIGIAIGSAGSIAGTLITSSQIKDGTIKLSDLSPATIKALRGKAGPIGRVGPAGPIGATGAAGSPGISGLTVVQATATGSGSAGATCPSGTRVIAGGAAADGDYALGRSMPSTDLNGWYANAALGDPAFVGSTSYAICAVVSP